MAIKNTFFDTPVQKKYDETKDIPALHQRYATYHGEQDAYPTRLEETADDLWQPRQEKVVKGRALSGPLSQAQLDEFECKGFLFIPELIAGKELESLHEELSALLDNDELRHKEFSITEPESEQIRSLFAVHRLSARLNELAQDERLMGAARQIIGDDPYIHQSRINYKPGFAGKGFNWHSDFETWHAEDGMPRMNAVSASLILTDNHEFNGPLMLIPGSHETFVPCLGKTPADNHRHSLKSQEIGVPDTASLTEMIRQQGIEAPKGKAGGLLLFDCNVLHASNANMSPDPRSNIFFVYNRPDNYRQQPFAAPARRPEFLAHTPDQR